MIMLESESDEEMRELLKEENSEAKRRIQELEQEMKILLLPKDPNDDKTLLWKSVRVRAEMKPRFLQRKCIVCM